MHTQSVLLTPPAPYDFVHTAAGARFLYTASRAMPDGSLRRAVRVGDALALISLSSVGTTDAPRIRVDLLTADGPIDPARFAEKAGRLLNPAADLSTFYQAAAGPLIETTTTLRGLHALGADTFFEALSLTMIEQQITLRMAQTAERWLMAWGGSALTYEGEIYSTFPTPARIAAATVEDLLPMKITGVRIGRMITLAGRIMSGDLPLETLRNADSETIYAALRSVSGVGHWTAAWAMIRAVGFYHYFGSADVALRAAANHYYHGLPGRMDREAMDSLFARLQPHDGLAAFYLLMRWAFERY